MTPCSAEQTWRWSAAGAAELLGAGAGLLPPERARRRCRRRTLPWPALRLRAPQLFGTMAKGMAAATLDPEYLARFRARPLTRRGRLMAGVQAAAVGVYEGVVGALQRFLHYLQNYRLQARGQAAAVSANNGMAGALQNALHPQTSWLVS